MTVKQLNSLLFSIILLSTLLLGCSIDKTDLVKIKGTGLTFSEFFKAYDGLDERENVKYYKPLPINEAENSLPDQVKNVVNSIESADLPFTVDEEKVFLVTSKDKEGKLKNQVQLSYLGKDEYGQTNDFFIVSVTEADKNPLASYDIKDETDSVGNILRKEMLTEELPIYQQVLTTDSALLYRYYEETDKGIAVVGTAANEFYAYYEGHIYHIGYLINRERNDEEMQEKMLRLVREYITASTFRQ